MQTSQRVTKTEKVATTSNQRISSGLEGSLVKKQVNRSKISSLIYNTKHQLNKLIKEQLISCTVAGNSDPAYATHVMGLEAG